MSDLQQKRVHCPYCGELIEVLLDHSEAEQSYIEDCSVCCRPICFSLSVDFGGEIELIVRSEDE
ncbi:MAG: CPXCG motif-containing cysteine-rich protein [Pseudomonadales bacterium]|nr:CPXCG motif-containing cysteine-rich protein [Pseudomonadales bacterium]